MEDKKDQSEDSEEPSSVSETEADDRRGFLSRISTIGVGAGLALGYGAFAVVAGKYLYPAGGAPKAWMFVRELEAMKRGDSLSFIGPAGESIAIARLEDTGEASDFIALSTVCPHLGCQVSWQGDKERFFCPCHNGIFDSAGVGIAGPPAKDGQSLSRYPLRVENGLLFIEVPGPDPRAAKRGPSLPVVARCGEGGEDES